MREAKLVLVNLRKEHSWFRAQNGSGVISILVTTEKISQIKLRSLINLERTQHEMFLWLCITPQTFLIM